MKELSPMQMVTESSAREMAKKLWRIVRAVLYMIRKGISKSRIMVDLQLMLKRGNKLAEKAIGNLFTFHHHHSASLSCRSDDALSFVSPGEYEFSCSNSPAHGFYSLYAHRHGHGHGHGHHHKYRRKYHHFAKSNKYDDATTVAAVQRMLEMLNGKDVVMEAVAPSPLPGFGKSPMVRQLRITDSPFPLKEEEDNNGLVDKAAEEFIKKFYKDLKLQ